MASGFNPESLWDALKGAFRERLMLSVTEGTLVTPQRRMRLEAEFVPGQALTVEEIKPLLERYFEGYALIQEGDTGSYYTLAKGKDKLMMVISLTPFSVSITVGIPKI